jgi:hypothetical protein
MIGDKIYFYTEDGTKFYSKLEAIEYSKKNNQKLSFYFYDDVYSKVDWKKELKEDLSYYYKQQALRLREKYDYLILAYSGGYDSTNILETFVYNNIKLDKIIVVGAFSKDSEWGVDENHNGEIYHNAIPYLEQLGLMNITEVIDYTKYLKDEAFKELSVYKLGPKWVYEIGSFFSVHNFFWRDAEKIITPKEWSEKKVGFILGLDKPQINQISEIEDKSIFSFTDAPVILYGNSRGYQNTERVRFYWDPEYTDLLIKQIQHLKSNSCFGPNQKTSASFLYDLKNPLKFNSPKTGNVFWSLRDTYLSNEKNTELFQFYKNGLEELDRVVGFASVTPVESRQYEI